MGVVTTASPSQGQSYAGRRHLSENLRERAETVKNVVRSFESLRELPRPFLQPFPALRSRGSCESIRSVAALLVSSNDSSPEGGDVRSAPGNIERSATLQVSESVSHSVSISNIIQPYLNLLAGCLQLHLRPEPVSQQLSSGVSR